MSAYAILDGPSILHHACGMRSYNPNDVASRYCGACHLFLDENEPLTAPLSHAQREAGSRCQPATCENAERPDAPSPPSTRRAGPLVPRETTRDRST